MIIVIILGNFLINEYFFPKFSLTSEPNDRGRMQFLKLLLSKMLVTILLSMALYPNAIWGQVHILYTSSLNGALSGCNCPGNPYGGIDRIIGTIKEFKKTHNNVLTIDSGDFFGTYPDEARDAIIWSALNNLPYDILIPGDQEFIYGIEYFNTLTADFRGRILRGAVSSNMPHVIDEEIIEFDHIKIAVLGWHTDDSFSFIQPKDLRWHKDIDIIKEKIEELKPEVNIVILVSHSGFDENALLVKAGVHPDIIICGHSQERVEKKIGSVVLIQAGMEGEMIGHLEINLKRKNTEINNSFITTAIVIDSNT